MHAPAAAQIEVEAKKEKKEKKPKKHRHRDHDVQLELIEEPAVDGAKDRAAGDSADAAPAKPAAAPVVQLPVEPVVAKPPKEKARNREQLKNSTMIVEEMEEGESFLRDYASDEVLLHIFTYMDPRTLGRCSQVCKRWHTVTEDRLLWIRHNRKEWLKSKDQSGAAAGKAFFLQRMNSFRRKKSAAEQNRQRILADAQARERRRQQGELQGLVLHSTVWDAVMMISFVLFLAFLSLRLDKVVLWHWHTVGIPLFIFVGLFVVRLTHIMIFAEEMDEGSPDSDSFSFVSKMFVRMMAGHMSIPDFIVIESQLLCLVAFVVLLFLKLDNVGDISLREVFAPVWIGFVLSLGFLMGDFAQGDYLTAVLSGLLPYMLYFLLIALKYDKIISVNWATVHAPLWAGVPLWVLAMWVWMMFIDEFSSAAETMFWVGLFGYLIVGIPVFLVFQIIMTVKLDKGSLWASKWRALFSPLFIFFGVIACISLNWVIFVTFALLDVIC